MNTVRWTIAFGAGSALLAGAVLNRIHARDGALEVHTDQKIDVQEAAVVQAPPSTSDVKRQAQQHYLSAVVFIQKGSFDKAVDELKIAAQLDPQDPEIATALRRYSERTARK